MKAYRAAVAVLLAALSGPVAVAQTSSRQPATTTAPAPQGIDPAAMAAARRLVIAAHTADTYLHAVDVLLPDLMRPLAQAHQLTHEQTELVMTAVRDELRADPATLVDMVAAIYATRLSVADLNALADFYATPAGQHVLAAMPAIQTDSANAGREWATRVLAPRLAQRIQHMIDHPTSSGHT